MTGFAVVLNIFVPRRIRNVVGLRIAEVLSVLAVSAFCVYYLYAAYRNRPHQNVEVDYRTLPQENLPSFGCSCSVNSFPASACIKYTLNDSDYTYCNGEFQQLAGEKGRDTCVTATYSLYGLLQENQWELVSENLMLSKSRLQAEIASQAKQISFTIWNTGSDVARTSARMAAGASAVAIPGYNLTRAYEEIEIHYAQYLAVEAYLPNLQAHMDSLMILDYPSYVKACAPVSCVVSQPVSVDSVLLSLPGIIGGYWTLIASICIAVIVGLEEKDIKHTAQHIMEYLRGNKHQLLHDHHVKALADVRPGVFIMHILDVLKKMNANFESSGHLNVSLERVEVRVGKPLELNSGGSLVSPPPSLPSSQYSSPVTSPPLSGTSTQRVVKWYDEV